MKTVTNGVKAAVVILLLTGCGPHSATLSPINRRPGGAASARAAINEFLAALEGKQVARMRQLMTPGAQENETDVAGGLLRAQPLLSSFSITRVARENPANNASPQGSIASRRFIVALTPPSSFDNDDTSGGAFGILVAESSSGRWLVAELGGGG